MIVVMQRCVTWVEDISLYIWLQIVCPDIVKKSFKMILEWGSCDVKANNDT